MEAVATCAPGPVAGLAYALVVMLLFVAALGFVALWRGK